MGAGVAGDHQKVTQARRLEVPGQGRIESGIVAESQAHQQAGLAWREQPGHGPTDERAARLAVRTNGFADGPSRRKVVTRISAAMAPRSRASDSLLGCFVSRQAPMSARLDDAPDNCERSQRLHQASSGRGAVAEGKLHGGLPVRSAPRRKRPGLRCRGSHPRRVPGGSQSALLTPQNLALSPPWAICFLVAFPSCRCESFGPEGRSPSGPPPFPRDSTFSRPSTEAALAFVQTRARTRWGVIGEPYPSGSAREQDKSRRSTWFLRAGSEGDGRFATGDRLGQTSGGPQRYRRDGPRREPDERGTRPRTRAPHGEARSEETAGRTIARRASGRDRSTR